MKNSKITKYIKDITAGKRLMELALRNLRKEPAKKADDFQSRVARQQEMISDRINQRKQLMSLNMTILIKKIIRIYPTAKHV